MLTDYKFCYITREDDGTIRKCAIRFHEGNITTENEMVNDELVPVTRYRRNSMPLKAKDLKYLKTKNIKENGNDTCAIYTTADFGVISTDDELRDFLDDELSKDTKRDPIEEQDKRILNKTKR